VGAADGWGRAVSGGGKSVACGWVHGRWVAWAVSGREARARGREGETWARIGPAEREGFFFVFRFSFSLFFFLTPFSFKQKFI
jgi:hypothetical protein